MYEAPCWDLRIQPTPTRTGRQSTPYGAPALTRTGVSQIITEGNRTPHTAASTIHGLEKNLLDKESQWEEEQVQKSCARQQMLTESEGQGSVRPAGSRGQQGNASRA